MEIEMKYFQEALKILGFYSGEISGEMDEKTKEAVRSIQKIIGEEPDGEISIRVLDYIKNRLGEISVRSADLQEYIQDVIDEEYDEFEEDFLED
jgi:peptidoglycan hydrolase-like protein with peptidoglycan-binding domain